MGLFILCDKDIEFMKIMAITWCMSALAIHYIECSFYPAPIFFLTSMLASSSFLQHSSGGISKYPIHSKQELVLKASKDTLRQQSIFLEEDF